MPLPYFCRVKILATALLLLTSIKVPAQCAMCTKTAAGLNDNSAEALNNGIIYLALIPVFLMISVATLWYLHSKGKIKL
jgi:hypothetical protein